MNNKFLFLLVVVFGIHSALGQNQHQVDQVTNQRFGSDERRMIPYLSLPPVEGNETPFTLFRKSKWRRCTFPKRQCDTG